MNENERNERISLDTVLDALRTVDHRYLDDRYDAISTYEDLKMLLQPMARLHRMAARGELANSLLGEQILKEIVKPSEVIVNYYTSGYPDFSLAYDDEYKDGSN